MAVVTLNGFRTVPGRLADHMAASAEAHGHLTRLGMQAATLQAVAGTDVGVIATIINYADNAAHVAGMQTIMASSTRSPGSWSAGKHRLRCARTWRSTR